MEYPESMEKQVDTVLYGINKVYPQLKVFLAAKTSQIEQIAKKYPNIKTVAVTKASSLGKVWNQLVNEVSSPYTLVARDVIQFSWETRIERQIRMISTTDHVAVAGGSFRNLSGHWRVGCRQTRLKNYVLQYEEGYHHSRYSCMFCDDLEGPFVAKTALLKSLKFNEKYNKEVVFEDFFLRVFRSGYLIMNCPDTMYFTTDYSTETKRNSKEIWRAMATDIQLVRIVLLDYGIRHAFSCNEISFKCDPFAVTKDRTLPACCLEQYAKAMQFFQDLCMKNNIHFEMVYGSALGGVKFNAYSPFDLDGDIVLSVWNFSAIVKLKNSIEQHGFRLSNFEQPQFGKDVLLKKQGYMKYYSPDIYTEVWVRVPLSNNDCSLPELNTPSRFTKCRLSNHWINCIYYPGIYSRNRYGPDILKHSQSWIQRGMGHSTHRYHPGQFRRCENPNFHSCLDKFPADGSIAFKVL